MLKSFDNLITYSISGFGYSSGLDVSAMLAQSIFSPCKESDLSRAGWIAGDDGVTPLSVINGNDAVFFFRVDKKKVSQPLINQRVKAGVSEWMRKTGYKKIKAFEKAKIKSAILNEEIKVAYTRTVVIPVLINFDSMMLFVGTGCRITSETVVSAMRSCCHSMPAIPVIDDASGSVVISNIHGPGISVRGGRFSKDSDNSYVCISAKWSHSLCARLVSEGYAPEYMEIKTNQLKAKVLPSLSLCNIKFNFRVSKTAANICKQVDAIKYAINSILR